MSFDSEADNKKFAEKFNFNFPLLCDTDRTIGTAYGANVDPAKGAQRVGVIIGPDGKIKHIFEKVKPEGHAEQVLDWLKEAQKGAA